MKDPDGQDAIGHVIDPYLHRSATFIYTSLRFQTAFKPVVFAGSTINTEEFPFDPLYELAPRAPLYRRVLRRAKSVAHRYPSSFEYQLARRADESHCVALHAHFGWLGAASIVAARRLAIPLVTTFYGHDLSNSLGRPYESLFRVGRLFVCEGPAMERHLQSVGCPSAKIRVVRIGIDLDQFPFAVSRRTDHIVILQAARFVEKKGIDLSIRALAVARRSLGGAELWLVGDGPLRADLESLAAELGVASVVKFLGLVSHDEYRAIARQAHVCIQPSRTAASGDTEGGAPTVLLEMQAMGIPVVATEHADIPSVVADPNLLAAEEDVDALARALIEVASISDDEYGARAQRARQHIEGLHDARVVAVQLADVYREALRADPPALSWSG